MQHRPALIALLAFLPWLSATQDVDTDGDGLTDFQECYKYLTNPSKADSDGDGVLDGDWHERREYQYTVRCVVQVMKPVTIEYLSDDYQDARVLEDSATWVKLEVVHYPFNTVADHITGERSWRQKSDMHHWTRPGVTANWTPDMQIELMAALKEDGIDVDKLDDLQTVERVSGWLLRRAEYHDGFSTFITAFGDHGKPYVPDVLQDAAQRGRTDTGLSLKRQWEREIFASGMFANRARGSCTSSAIYLNGCLRAIGIPTRIVLCIPIIDASDKRELDLVRTGISHYRMRHTILSALSSKANSWTSHTFNEVFVGDRWRRLNYDKLGQNILDPNGLGLMTHVATFFDWADAKMSETVGLRQGLSIRDDVFGGANPYSTIALNDDFGPHCKIKNTPETVTVGRLFWADSPKLPEDVRAGLMRRDAFGLVAYLTHIRGTDLRSFLARVDLRVFVEASGKPTLTVGFDAGCWWQKNDVAWIYIPFGSADRSHLVNDVTYRFRPRNGKQGAAWSVADRTDVIRR